MPPQRTLDPVQPAHRLVDQAYQILKEAILTWKILPGERLRQESLAHELGVSQMTVREALGRLIAEGLASHQPYKGTQATPNSSMDVEDLYEIRALLEGLAMQLAAEHLTPEELSQMQSLLPQTLFSPQQPDQIDQVRQANHQFHWIAIEACGRKHLIRFLAQIWGMLDAYLLYSPELSKVLSPEQTAHSVQEDLDTHTRLLAALAARDGAEANQITQESVRAASNDLQASLEAARFERNKRR